MIEELCPRCVGREIDSDSGFCSVCDAEALTERYLASKASEVAQRRRDWAERTQEALRQYWVEKQRNSRLFAKVRPRQAASDFRDPLALGFEVLALLEPLRLRFTTVDGLRRFEEALELIRQLAWGPDERRLMSNG